MARKVNSGSLPGLILNELYNNLYVETSVSMSLFLLLYTLTLFSIIPCTAMSHVVYHIKKLLQKKVWSPNWELV